MGKDIIEYKQLVTLPLNPYVYFIEGGTLDLSAFKAYSTEQIKKVMTDTGVLQKLALREAQVLKPIIPYKKRYAIRQFVRRRGHQRDASLTVKGDAVTKYRLLKSGNISVHLSQSYTGKKYNYVWDEAAHIYKPDSPGYNRALSKLEKRHIGAKSRIERKRNTQVNFISLMLDKDARKEFDYRQDVTKTYKSGRKQYYRAMERPPHLRDVGQYYVNEGKIVAKYSVQKAPDDRFIEGNTEPYAGYVYYRTNVSHENEYTDYGTSHWLEVFFSGGQMYKSRNNGNAVSYAKNEYPKYMEYAKKLFLEKLNRK